MSALVEIVKIYDENTGIINIESDDVFSIGTGLECAGIAGPVR